MFGITFQLIDYSIQNTLHIGMIWFFIGASKVLINGLSPSGILMGVHNNMDCHMLVLVCPVLLLKYFFWLRKALRFLVPEFFNIISIIFIPSIVMCQVGFAFSLQVLHVCHVCSLWKHLLFQFFFSHGSEITVIILCNVIIKTVLTPVFLFRSTSQSVAYFAERDVTS